MARPKQSIERVDAVVQAHDHTYAMALELIDRLGKLRLAYRATANIEAILPNSPELCAASQRLRRLLAEISNLDSRAEQLNGLLRRCRSRHASRPEQDTGDAPELDSPVVTPGRARRLS